VNRAEAITSMRGFTLLVNEVMSGLGISRWKRIREHLMRMYPSPVKHLERAEDLIT
jgi:hypothetical protein